MRRSGWLGIDEERALAAERERLRGQLAELRRTATRLEDAMVRARAALIGGPLGGIPSAPEG